MLASLRGNIFLYQGQELGLEQDDIPFHLLKDPEAIANWPLTLSRDGVRTPMPWDGEHFHAGFTQGEPWLPLSPTNIAKSVAGQEVDPDSQLHWTRAMLALREQYPALKLGVLEDAQADGALLTFTRSHEGQSIACAFNLSGEAIAYKAPKGSTVLAVSGATDAGLPPYAALWVQPG